MSRHSLMEYSRVLLLVRPQHQTGADKAVYVAGQIAQYTLLAVLVLYISQLPWQESAWKPVVNSVTVAAVLVYLLALALLSMRTIGEYRHQKGYRSQLLDVAKHLLIYGLLPVVGLALVLFGVISAFIVVTHFFG